MLASLLPIRSAGLRTDLFGTCRTGLFITLELRRFIMFVAFCLITVAVLYALIQGVVGGC